MDTGEAGPGQVLYLPKEAARRLGVSGSGLRRLAGIYAELYGPLPRDESEQGPNKTRLWPAEAIGRLERARALMDAKRYNSIKEALEGLERGEDTPQALDLSTPPSDELRRRVEALAALPAQVDELAKRQGEALVLLRDLVTTVERLEAKVEQQAPLEEGKAEHVAAMEAVHADLERRNNYLLGELERRRLAAEKPQQRPWWKFWRA